MDTKKIVKFLSEVLMLKREKHAGVKMAGVENLDSIAEHIAVAAQIAFIGNRIRTRIKFRSQKMR